MTNPIGLLEYLEANVDLTVNEGLVVFVLGDSLIAKLKAARTQVRFSSTAMKSLPRLLNSSWGL